MHQQGMKRCKLVIYPPATKAHAQNHRRGHMTKCLVEINGLLFTHPVLAFSRDTGQRFWGGAVHISDHSFGQ